MWVKFLRPKAVDLSLVLSLRTPRAKYLNTREGYTGALSIVRAYQSLGARQTCVPGLSEAPCCPAPSHPLPQPCLDLLPVSPLIFSTLHFSSSPSSSICYPCCVFAPNFPSAWNILTLPSSHSIPLFTFS